MTEKQLAEFGLAGVRAEAKAHEEWEASVPYGDEKAQRDIARGLVVFLGDSRLPYPLFKAREWVKMQYRWKMWALRHKLAKMRFSFQRVLDVCGAELCRTFHGQVELSKPGETYCFKCSKKRFHK